MDTGEVNYRMEVVELRGKVDSVVKDVDHHAREIDTIKRVQSEQLGALKTIKWLAGAGPVVYGLINFLIKVNG